MTTKYLQAFSERGRRHLINELCNMYNPVFISRFLDDAAIEEYLEEINAEYCVNSELSCTLHGFDEIRKAYFDDADFVWTGV